MIHVDDGILKWAVKLWKDMEEPWMHLSKRKKPIWKDYIPYKSNCMTLGKKQKYGDYKKIQCWPEMGEGNDV